MCQGDMLCTYSLSLASLSLMDLEMCGLTGHISRSCPMKKKCGERPCETLLASLTILLYRHLYDLWCLWA